MVMNHLGTIRGGKCECVVKNREESESQREWMKGWMCMFHWMQTDYYQNKLEREQGELRLHLDNSDTNPERVRPGAIHTICQCDKCRSIRVRKGESVP